MNRLIPRLEREGFVTVSIDEMFCTWSQAGAGLELWTPVGRRHYAKWNGSRSRVCVFGALADDGRRLFRTYKKFNSRQFVVFLEETCKKFGRVLVVMDRASPHRSGAVEQYLLENPDVRIEYLPTGCPEFNPAEACWNVIKGTVCKSAYYGTFGEMRDALSEFMRTCRFASIVLYKYLFRKPFEIQNFFP